MSRATSLTRQKSRTRGAGRRRKRRFEPMPETPPRPPRCPEPRIAAAARRRKLRRARREIAAFRCANRYQARLQGVALAMMAYMDKHWCGPGHAYDFDRWWRIVDYYARALDSPELAGNSRQAHKAVEKILDQNQVPPSQL